MFDKSVLAAAACLAGFGIVFYFQNNQKKSSDSEKQLVSATYKVEAKHLAFLKDIQAKYAIKDISKAVRVAIQFVMEEKTEEKKIFTEKICNTCGGKKSKQDINLDIYPKQKAFLQSITKSYDVKDEDKAMRCLLEYAETKGDRDAIFKTVRCRSC